MNLDENDLFVPKEDSILRIARRGTEAEDTRWFSEEAVIMLKKAQDELQWLLNRGYKSKAVIELIGGHYQLSVRQRNALLRSTCSSVDCIRRKSKCLLNDCVKGNTIYIDGFNLIITLEVALSDGVLVLGRDGLIRDLAGLRGTYSIIDKTEKSLNILGSVLDKLEIKQANFFLDAPVSNSGRLKNLILQHASGWNCNVEVNVVPNADLVLKRMDHVVTSDSIILDECISWFNLSKLIIGEHMTKARVIDLSGD